MTTQLPNSPLLIIGCQRSGTTLLRAALGNHPDLLEHPDEPQYLLGIQQRFGLVVRDVATAVTYIATHPHRPQTLTPETLRAAYAGHTALPLPQFMQIYLQAWGGPQLTTHRPILKDPAWIFHLPDLHTWFPSAHIIHIIRDPRANVSSQITRWPEFTIWEAATLWSRALRMARAWGQAHPANYTEISYEALIRQPEATFTTLCHALHLPYHPALLQFEENTILFDPGQAQRHTFRGMDPSRLDVWRQRLSPADVWLIEQACQQEMTWYAYPRYQTDPPDPTWVRRLRREQLYYGYKKMGKWGKATWRTLRWRLGYGH